MLTIDTIPLRLFWILDFRFRIEPENVFSFNPKSQIQNPKLKLFVLFVNRVATATTAKLFEFETLRCRLFILGRNVVAFFALGAL